MPTKIDKSNLNDLGDKSDADKIEKVVAKTDTTLSSVERIAGKVENIMGMITKFKGMGIKPEEKAPTTFKNVAEEKPKPAPQRNAKIKIKTEQLVLQLEELLKNLDDKKTVEDIKKEIDKAKKLGMINKIVEDFVLNNCEVEYD